MYHRGHVIKFHQKKFALFGRMYPPPTGTTDVLEARRGGLSIAHDQREHPPLPTCPSNSETYFYVTRTESVAKGRKKSRSEMGFDTVSKVSLGMSRYT